MAKRCSHKCKKHCSPKRSAKRSHSATAELSVTAEAP